MTGASGVPNSEAVLYVRARGGCFDWLKCLCGHFGELLELRRAFANDEQFLAFTEYVCNGCSGSGVTPGGGGDPPPVDGPPKGPAACVAKMRSYVCQPVITAGIDAAIAAIDSGLTASLPPDVQAMLPTIGAGLKALKAMCAVDPNTAGAPAAIIAGVCQVWPTLKSVIAKVPTPLLISVVPLVGPLLAMLKGPLGYALDACCDASNGA